MFFVSVLNRLKHLRPIYSCISTVGFNMEQFEESDLVGCVVAFEFELLPVQYSSGARLGLGTHFRHEAPGSLRVRTAATGSN